MKALIVSGNRQTEPLSEGRTMSPIELFWTAKNIVHSEEIPFIHSKDIDIKQKCCIAHGYAQPTDKTSLKS